MKLKILRKKIRRLEKRLQEGPKKLAKLRRKLEAMEAVKSQAKKPRRKVNLSPERRAQLAAAMKARWAAKRALVEAVPQIVPTDQASIPERTPQTLQSEHNAA
jgi:hypothetical protein